MDRRAVPDEEEAPFEMPLQVPDELHDLLALDAALVDLEVETPQAQPADDREALPAEALVQQWGLPAQRPGPHPRGPGAQSTLINKDDDAPLPPRVFFSAGQVLRCHARTCFSSRSMARRSGRWQEKPIAPSTRHTWPG